MKKQYTEKQKHIATFEHPGLRCVRTKLNLQEKNLRFALEKTKKENNFGPIIKLLSKLLNVTIEKITSHKIFSYRNFIKKHFVAKHFLKIIIALSTTFMLKQEKNSFKIDLTIPAKMYEVCMTNVFS